MQPSWLWEGIGNYYAAGGYGLNYRDNSYDLILDTSKKNTKPTVIKTEPYIPGMIFENYLSDKNIPFDSAYIYGAPFSDKRFITGAVPHKNNRFIIKGDIPDPSEFMAYSIKSLLEKNGVEVDGKYTSARRIFLEKKKLPADLHLLATYYSPSVSSLSRIANELSNNLYAEALMKYSASKAGKGNDMQQISSFIKDYWKNKGINTDALFIYDGNGLSPSDRITPTFFTSLLFYMKDNKAFIESLPIAGSEGTVKNFLKDQSLRNKFRLKSGTIKQVVAYTGYISDDQTEKNINQKYAVSVIINNHTCNSANLRKAIEKMFVDLKL